VYTDSGFVTLDSTDMCEKRDNVASHGRWNALYGELCERSSLQGTPYRSSHSSSARRTERMRTRTHTCPTGTMWLTALQSKPLISLPGHPTPGQRGTRPLPSSTEGLHFGRILDGTSKGHTPPCTGLTSAPSLRVWWPA
jgi:hypothetical protein